MIILYNDIASKLGLHIIISRNSTTTCCSTASRKQLKEVIKRLCQVYVRNASLINQPTLDETKLIYRLPTEGHNYHSQWS